jgi:acyl carrier protein
METFLNQMAELLEVNSVSPQDEITSFETWDSLTSLSIISLLHDEYNIIISRQDILEAKTVEGMYQFIQSKK